MIFSRLQRGFRPWQQTQPLKLPLRLVLTVPFVLLTIGTTGLVGYLCIRNGQQAVADLAQQLMFRTGDRVNLYLSDYLKTPQLVNRLNASAIRLNQIDITDPQSLERHFVQQIQAFDSVSRIHFSNPEGGYVSVGNDERGLTTASTEDFTKGTLRVHAIDPQGNRREMLVEQSGYDASQRPFHRRAVEAKKPVWTPVYAYVPASRGLGISASYPLYDETQRLQGVLSSDLTLTAIHQFLAKLRIGEHGAVFIVDRSGLMIASSTPEPLLNTSTDQKTAQLSATASETLPIRLSTQHLIAQFGDLNKIDRVVQLQFDLDGKRQFLQVTPFQDEFGLDWLTVITVPETDFTGQIATNTRNTILLSAAALISSILLGLLLAGRIARSIQRLSRASHDLASGMQHESLQEDSPIVELQMLTDSFNQMAQQLQQSFDRVNSALQQSETRLQQLAAASPAIIYTVEEYPGRFVRFEYLSPAFEEIHEIPIAEVFRDVSVVPNSFHPDDRAGHQQAVIQALETMQPFKHEWRIITPSGKVKWIQGNSRPERRDNGVIVWHGVVLDITDRKQAEAALQQSEARFQRLVTAAPGAIYTLVKRSDQSFYFEYVSPAIEEINELTVEQTLNSSAEALMHPDDRADYEAAVAHSAMTLEAFSREFRIITPSGKLKWLHASSRPEQRENGEIAWYGIVVDISEQKQAEEALQQSETRLQSLATAAPVNIYSLVQHLDGTIEFEYVNHVAEEFHEVSLEEFLSDPQRIIMEQMHPDDQQGYLAAMTCSAQTLERFQYEWRIITPSGKLKWLQARSQPERRENGDVCWHGVVLDVSDRKQAEEALRRSEERNRAIVSAIPDLMTLVSAEGIYLDAIRSNALVDLVPPEINPVGKHLTEILPPEIAATQIQLIQSALATREVQVFEQQLWFDGRRQYEELRVVPCGKDAVLTMIRNITDRKQAEEALQHSEAALRRAQQVAHIGSWEVDVQTERVIWSEESFHIFGRDVTQTEPSLSQFYELIHPDDRSILQSKISHIIAHGGSYKTEFRIIHPSGLLRYVEARGEAVKNEQGQVVQLLGTNLDITERHQAETALRQSEATKNQILRAIPDLIAWMTADGTCIDLIDGYSATNLYKRSEAIGKNLYNLLPPALAQLRMNAIQQALRTGEVQNYEQQFSVNNEIRYEEVRVIGVGEDRVLVIVRNITDRKRSEAERERAEAALVESETRFRSAFWDAPIGMALIGLDDRWIKVNPMLCEMLSIPESELLSMPASSLVHPEDLEKLRQCIQQVLSHESRNAQVELRYCRHQGNLIWGLMSLSLVRNAQNEPFYYVAQIQDITERQAVDRMKNEFISIVSHELRTPLTAIRGFLGLLDTGIYDNKPAKAKHMINQALTNSDRLVRLVNDILDLERLSSGRAQFVMETCNAEALMQQAATVVQSIADQASVTLKIVQTTAQVWADADSIIQTLTNLLGNAVKFSPANSVVTLSAQAQSDGVLFSVIDQGRGIPADKLETIFGRFQQVDVSDSRQKGGTGLGLAICQSIVQQHGGNIWAESTFGEGSTFYFTLPFPSE